MEDEMIKDRIVLGFEDNHTRKKLLQEKKLDLQRCMTYADLTRSRHINLNWNLWKMFTTSRSNKKWNTTVKAQKTTTYNQYLLFILVVTVGEHICGVERNAQRLDRLATCVASRTISRKKVLTNSRLSQSIMESVVVHWTADHSMFMGLRLMKVTHQMNSFLLLSKCTHYHQNVIQLLWISRINMWNSSWTTGLLLISYPLVCTRTSLVTRKLMFIYRCTTNLKPKLWAP